MNDNKSHLKNNNTFNKNINYFLLNSNANNLKIINFINNVNSDNSSFDYIINSKKYNSIFLLNNIIIDKRNKKLIIIPNFETNNFLINYVTQNFEHIPTEEFLNSINKNKNTIIFIEKFQKNVLYECEKNNMIKININNNIISYNKLPNIINWYLIKKMNKLDIFVQHILDCFTEYISDHKIEWLNTAYNDIFNIEFFVNKIKQSNYLILDQINKKVLRKEIYINQENINPKFNLNAPEFIPKYDTPHYNPVYSLKSDDTELLINKMVDSLFD